jgi:hypothetical protein
VNTFDSGAVKLPKNVRTCCCAPGQHDEARANCCELLALQCASAPPRTTQVVRTPLQICFTIAGVCHAGCGVLASSSDVLHRCSEASSERGVLPRMASVACGVRHLLDAYTTACGLCVEEPNG